MEPKDNMTDTQLTETSQSVLEWLHSDTGNKKLTEMLQQATKENEQYRQAGQLDPDILSVAITL